MGEQLEAGYQVADRYEIEALVGTGGFADVYRARHLELGSYHALKVLTWRKKGLAERFINEGRVQATLGHPNVVTVTDVLRFDGHVALVMEYIDGTNLEAVLNERGALPLNEAMALFVPVLAAVAAAHDRKIWHRDLKPANVLLARTPVGWVPKVADFGIAKIVEEMGGSNTSSGIAMGSPGYMAPEQVRDSSTVDQRTDIFALGCILYEMLTGLRAFADKDGVLTITSTIDREPPPITDPAIPPAIASAVARAMQRDREQRFPDCRALAGALGIGGHPLLLDAEGRAMFASLDFDGSQPPTLGSRSSTPVPSTTPTSAGGWLLVPFAAGTFALVSAGVLLLAAAVLGVSVHRMMEEESAEVVPIIAPAPPPEPKPPAPTAPQPPDALGVAAAPDPVPDTVAAAPVAAVPAPPAPLDPADPPQPVPTIPAPPPDPAPAVAEVEPVALPDLPDPAPERPAPPTPQIDPSILVGTWKGKAQQKPIELTFTSATDEVVRGEFVFAGVSRISFSGSLDTRTGKLLLISSDKRNRFEGRLQGQSISGTYQQGTGKLLEWSVSR